jgi:Zn-dependent protease/CBS domain-containing protein
MLGIPIRVDASWLLILALLTWSISNIFKRELPGLPNPHYWIMGLIAAFAFFVCIVLHELGHAVVARRMGIPIRGITLFLFGGVAEMADEPPSAGAEFLMAIGGPIVSAVLGGLFLGLGLWGAAVGFPTQAMVVLQYLGWINFLVLAFNLIPAFPLDGGRVLRSIFWGATGSLRRATYWASLLGQAFAWLFIFFGVFQFIGGLVISGIWIAVIGLFLNHAARASYQQVIIHQALQGEPVRRFMNPNPITVPPNTGLREFVENYVYRYHRKLFPVAADGHLEGSISTRALSRLPPEEWDHHTVEEVMRRDLRAISIGPNADALQALGKMQRTGSSRLLVIHQGQLLGIVSLKDLLHFLHLKMELQAPENGEPEPGELDHEDSRHEPPVSSHA